MNSIQFTLQERDSEGDLLLVIPLCFFSLKFPFHLFIYTAYITVLQLTQLRGKPQSRETEGDRTGRLLVGHESASATNP